MARYWTWYAQCPRYDASHLGAPSPQEQRDNWRHNLEHPRETRRDIWKPQGCLFVRTDHPDDVPAPTIHHSGEIEERDIIAEQWRCAEHGLHPVLWARRGAFRRRTQPLIDQNWELKLEPMEYTVWGRTQTTHISIHIRRRPAPRTMHSAWASLARP